MNDPDQARMLLNMAFKDHRALRAMRDLDEVATEIFGFHVQQAIEKGIKAW
ncbi:MAG: DNA-binding protein, partial [Magnetococcales bacterium]|nr:DNA-binding protein [Magnetococcales bacterium]